MERRRVAEAAKGVGKPKIGGKFELMDQEGRKFTDEDMKGGYSLVSASEENQRYGRLTWEGNRASQGGHTTIKMMRI